jgi:hypothetical protein
MRPRFLTQRYYFVLICRDHSLRSRQRARKLVSKFQSDGCSVQLRRKPAFKRAGHALKYDCSAKAEQRLPSGPCADHLNADLLVRAPMLITTIRERLPLLVGCRAPRVKDSLLVIVQLQHFSSFSYVEGGGLKLPK